MIPVESVGRVDEVTDEQLVDAVAQVASLCHARDVRGEDALDLLRMLGLDKTPLVERSIEKTSALAG